MPLSTEFAALIYLLWLCDQHPLASLIGFAALYAVYYFGITLPPMF